MDIKEIIVKLEYWCAYQDRCTFEAIQKLEKYALSTAQIDEVIAHLKANKFIDDERFALSFASGKFRLKHWGKIKIRYHLKQKRISDNLISSALYTIDENEYEACVLDLIHKKKKELTKIKDAYQFKSKIINYLQAKGFELDIVLSVFNKT